MTDALKQYKTFAVNEVTTTGATVKYILASTDKCFLYVDEDGHLGCEFDDTTCVDGHQSAREAMGLYVQLQHSGLLPN